MSPAAAGTRRTRAATNAKKLRFVISDSYPIVSASGEGLLR
jgi:hypothetical protein